MYALTFKNKATTILVKFRDLKKNKKLKYEDETQPIVLTKFLNVWSILLLSIVLVISGLLQSRI